MCLTLSRLLLLRAFWGWGVGVGDSELGEPPQSEGPDGGGTGGLEM